MDNLDKNFINAIINVLEEKLQRTLTDSERKAFSVPRSLMAYEMILDYITDKEKSQKEIVQYVAGVISEQNS